jgi:hypothetical protein
MVPVMLDWADAIDDWADAIRPYRLRVNSLTATSLLLNDVLVLSIDFLFEAL